MKHFLTIGQLSQAGVKKLIKLSVQLENSGGASGSGAPLPLQRNNILFVFEKPSLRTKVGTEVAINQLGGNVIHVPPENFFEGKMLFADKKKHKIAGREALKDTVQNVSQWCDAIFARVFSHQTLLNVAKFSDVPVVNALCDKHHPMQALADLLTLQQVFGTNKVTLAFVGDANNVAFSLFEIMLLFGHHVRLASPKAYSFSAARQQHLQKLAAEHAGKVEFLHDPIEAVRGADVIYTDTFVSMGEEDVYQEKMRFFQKYQVNKELFSYAKKDTFFMHCLPAHRGIEVTNEIMDSKASLVYQQAKNRMIVSKGVFTKLLNPEFRW